MTEAQAHQFAAHWGRLIFRQEKDDVEKVKALERDLVRTGLGGIFFIASASSYRTTSFRDGMLIFGLLMFLSACGGFARTRTARRVLEKSQISNLKS